MAKSVGTRIAERNRLAAHHREGQGEIAQTVGSAGLAVANTWERVSGLFKGDRTIFAGATAFGLARGAVVGGLVGLVIIASGGSALIAGGVTALGAAIAGVKDGQLKLEHHWRKQNHQLADRIAETTGAVPIPGPKLFKGRVGDTPEEELKRTGLDPQLMQKMDAILQNDPGFAARERMRRETGMTGPTVLSR